MTGKKRPDVLTGKTIRIKSGCGNVYITLNKDEDGNLFEVRLTLGKAGSCKNNEFFIIGVFLSVLLQSGLPHDKIKKTLQKHLCGVKCENPFEYNNQKNATCYDVIAHEICNELK